MCDLLSLIRAIYIRLWSSLLEPGGRSSECTSEDSTSLRIYREPKAHQQGLESCESFSHPQLTVDRVDRNERKKRAGRKVGGRGGKRVISIYYTHVCNYQRANLVNKPVKFKKVKKKDAKVSKQIARMHS